MIFWISHLQAAALGSYTIRDSESRRNKSVSTVSFDSAPGLNHNAIKKVNAALITASTLFRKEAKECGEVAQGHPWEYKVTFEKILESADYISVVFAKSTVCAGSPDIEKEARVFSLPNGELVPAKVLFKRLLPSSKLRANPSSNKELVRLDEEMVETMIDDSKEVLNNYDQRCEFYLKNTSYRIWTDGKNAILFPEFIQPKSFCQKEYLIRLSARQQ